MEFKDVKFSLGKVDSDAGKFDGYASVFDVIDSYGDIVEKGAFKRTLKANGQFPLLWSHDVTQPIGKVVGEEDDKGLRIQGELNLDLTSAQEKRSLMKQGVIKATSIGYETIKALGDMVNDISVRRLKEIKLWEVSLVLFPANPKAIVGNIKCMADLSATLEKILTMDIKSIDKDQRELAVKAIDRIRTLLEDDPLNGTHTKEDPSLEPLFAAVREAQRHIKQI